MTPQQLHDADMRLMEGVFESPVQPVHPPGVWVNLQPWVRGVQGESGDVETGLTQVSGTEATQHRVRQGLEESARHKKAGRGGSGGEGTHNAQDLQRRLQR